MASSSTEPASLVPPVAAPVAADASVVAARWPWWRIVLLALALLVPAVVRGYYLCLMPLATGDLERHLLYGTLVGRFGYGVADVPLSAFGPRFFRVAWCDYPYNYPPMALLFFSAVALVSSSMFYARLMLTLVEAANSWLIWRLSGRLLPALVYWAAPASLLWASREGQYEPLQNIFTLAALLCLGACGPRPVAARWRPLAWPLLALGVQSKLSAVLLLPWFAWRTWRLAGPVRGEQLRALLRGLGLFVVGFAPLALMSQAYPSLRYTLEFSAPLEFNPYHWDILSLRYFSWVPTWQLWFGQLASYALIAVLLWCLWRGPARFAALPPLAMVLLFKTHTNVQFWYWLLFPPLLMPLVPAGRAASRRLVVLLLLWVALDAFAARQVLWKPGGIGTLSEQYYARRTAFQPTLKLSWLPKNLTISRERAVQEAP